MSGCRYKPQWSGYALPNAQALEISEKNLGEKHPRTIKIRRTYCEIVNYQAIQARNEEMMSLEQPDMGTDTKDHSILIGADNSAIDQNNDRL